MNVTVENLAPCKKLVRFEVDAKAVDEAFGAVTKDFVKQAKMSGFRPGKAPEAMVARQYAKDIEEEVKRKLIGDAYRQGIKDHKFNVVGYPDLRRSSSTAARRCNSPRPSRSIPSLNCRNTAACRRSARRWSSRTRT